MDQILPKYQLNLTTWIYLSSLLTIAIYFKFSRFWSMRNLDLVGLVLLAPGLLLIDQNGDLRVWGFVWLFVMGLFFLLRLLADPRMVRRPLLEPNLSTGGLTFLGCCLLVFLMVNVATRDVLPEDLEGARRLDAMLSRTETPADDTGLMHRGPGYIWLHLLPRISMGRLVKPDAPQSDDTDRLMVYIATARAMAMLSHLAVVIGLVVIGLRHFDNVRTGIAAAVLYLLLPYTAQMTGRVDHVLPAALLVWAVQCYRRPLLSGMLLGLATGTIYYPLFLLPLWVGFYWQRGRWRFLTGFFTTLVLLLGSLVFTSSSLESFLAQAKQMLGWTSLSLAGVNGFWQFDESAYPYRLVVMALFVVMSLGFALWPMPKNLGTLLSCSAALMLGVQFWHAQGGGIYMAWYLPLLLLTIFRPNLEDRVAVNLLSEWGGLRRHRQVPSMAA